MDDYIVANVILNCVLHVIKHNTKPGGSRLSTSEIVIILPFLYQLVLTTPELM